MIFSGNNFLSINDQTGINFSIDLNFNNASGLCELGFSGSNPNSIPKEKISYTFNKSKIYDPENRFIYYYNNTEKINLSGSISSDQYSYYINDNLICLNGKKENFILNKFYLNTSGCRVTGDLKIFGDIPNYNINFQNFNVGNLLTGIINNNSFSSFRIYSGTVSVPTGFSINLLNLDVLANSSTSNIKINTYNGTINQTGNTATYPITLNLYTNFGLASKTYNVTGNLINTPQVILDLFKNFDSDLLKTINGINQIKNQEYILDFNIVSGKQYLPKNLYINLSYDGGKTGLFHQDLPATGVQNINLTGLVTGEQILRKNVPLFAATGYDFFTNIQKTGNITGIAESIVYATGFNTTTGAVNATGFFKNNFVFETIKFNKSGFSENGITSYSNSDINDYKFYENNIFTGSGVNNHYLFGHDLVGNFDHSILAISAPSGIVQNRSGAGLVYIFTGNFNNNNIWHQNSVLSANNANTGDNFGFCLSMNDSGNLLAIGAPNKTLGEGSGAMSGAGAVYIFNRNFSNWSQSTMLTGSNSNTGDKFGSSLQMSNDGLVLAVGAPNKNAIFGSSILTGAGQVAVFENRDNQNNWIHLLNLTGKTSGDGFGASVSLSSNGALLAVGATGRNIGSSQKVGAIYLYSGNQYTSSLWQEFSYLLTGNSSSQNDNLGTFIKVTPNGETVFAASTNNSTGAGHVYVFTGNVINNNRYAQHQRLIPADRSAQDNFGFALDINKTENLLCISSPKNSYLDNNSFGSCYIFEKNNLFWEEKQKITGLIPHTQSQNQFGYSILFDPSRDNLLISSPFFDTGQYNNIGLIYNFNKVNLTGYLGIVSGTGIVSYDILVFTTGLITGIEYTKRFLDVFELQTGYYTGNQLVGIASFKTGNFINNQSYVNSINVNENIYNMYLSVKTKNYPDNDSITGKLIISGYDNSNNYSSVITEYITGIK